MHDDILTKNQKTLLPIIQQFSGQFYLAGGTAIALPIGHRRSIDFDLCTQNDIERIRIQNTIKKNGFNIQKMMYEAFDQMHCLVHDVKLTFFHFPYTVRPAVSYYEWVKMPALIDLAAMKAFALGGRGKWKDYVDLYFLLKFHCTLQNIETRAKKMFGDVFNEKLFREQLSYFQDIDYSEEVEFVSNAPGNEDIKAYLSEVAFTKI